MSTTSLPSPDSRAGYLGVRAVTPAHAFDPKVLQPAVRRIGGAPDPRSVVAASRGARGCALVGDPSQRDLSRFPELGECRAGVRHRVRRRGTDLRPRRLPFFIPCRPCRADDLVRSDGVVAAAAIVIHLLPEQLSLRDIAGRDAGDPVGEHDVGIGLQGGAGPPGLRASLDASFTPHEGQWVTLVKSAWWSCGC